MKGCARFQCARFPVSQGPLYRVFKVLGFGFLEVALFLLGFGSIAS